MMDRIIVIKDDATEGNRLWQMYYPIHHYTPIQRAMHYQRYHVVILREQALGLTWCRFRHRLLTSLATVTIKC